MPRAPARVYPKLRVVPCGPWEGMTDTIEPQTARPSRAQVLQNCYATTTDVGVAVVGVPGFVAVGSQQGSPGNRASQWVGQFNTTDGTKRSLWIVNGEIVEYSHGSDTFTTRITAANLAAASGTITLSATARVYACVFADQLIVTDGVNTAFAWDGTAGGGLTKLTNCPVIYGQPWPYYSKLFVRKAAEPDVIAWSEEGDPNLGYEAGGYSNVWELGGTYAEPIHAVVATNEYLGVIRPRSTTAIYGAVNDEFKTTGTRNAVSERIGTTSPGGALVTDEGTFVLDADGRPQFWARGSGYLAEPPLWADCEITTKMPNRAVLDRVEMLADDTAGLIWIGIPQTLQSYPSQWLLYERTGTRPNLVGTVTGFVSQRSGIWEDGDGVRRIVHTGVDDGYCYLHGTPDGDDWSYAFTGGTVGITHEVVFCVPTADIVQDQYFDRLTLASTAQNNQTVSVEVETPEGVTFAQTVQIVSGGTGAIFGTALFGTATFAATGVEQKSDLNLHARGRWAYVRVRHNIIGEPFNLTQALVESFVDGREPLVA